MGMAGAAVDGWRCSSNDVMPTFGRMKERREKERGRRGKQTLPPLTLPPLGLGRTPSPAHIHRTRPIQKLKEDAIWMSSCYTVHVPPPPSWPRPRSALALPRSLLSFSSWNACSSNVTSAYMRRMLGRLQSTGLAAKGYHYLSQCHAASPGLAH